MPMYARELRVRTYRNFAHYTLELSPGVTVLVGRNAQGKTNLVEALQILTAGVSFRRPSPAELVQEGCEGCTIALRLEGDGRVVDHVCEVVDGKRRFMRNGKRVPASGVRGCVPSVLFCPDDLDMVKRSAGVRRQALDAFGMQLNEQYARLVDSYARIVEQRNTLLKERWCTCELLAAWNDSLVSCAASLLMHRTALLGRLRAHVARVYASIAHGERADVAYEAIAGVLPDPGTTTASREAFIAAATDLMRARLDEMFEEELRRGMTLVGPHRDEIAFTVDGRAARTFASQGQQRSLVLAWKVAEVEVTRDILGYPPLLLLDDVMSELDASRREAFLGLIQDEVQTVITTTNLGYFSDEVRARAKVVSVGDAEA